MLTELRRVEERLQPFIQRAHLILEAATTADYNNNVRSPLLIMLSSLITLTRHHVYFNVNANEFKIEEQLFSQQNINFFFFFFTISVDKNIKNEL